MALTKGNEFRIQLGELRNGLGRPKTARTIKKDAAKALRVAAGPLVDLAIERALSGSEPALCAVLNLLASGFGEPPPTKRVEVPADAPIVG
ncbi:hypothetical protein [Paraburkholderia nemoris]|uniref:hypothetical protein n=1 Tax=Paraburkholderia nemoris TaxID=2793076 RepID=UPI001B15E984|nr:hypothetical protein [Paraburkholderia nemoris]CAE6724876.1 hypothetical protein LMG22931_01910 [Paraburkholderia nemoris]